MSRIGKKPIKIPADVVLTIKASSVTVKGPKGTLVWNLPRGVLVEKKDDKLIVSISSDTKNLKALWGTNRAVIANMVEGVHKGYEKKLEIEGIGYKASVQDNKLTLRVGFSHPVEILPPEGITFETEKNVITVSGIDKALVGEVAAKVRAVRKPEPYKGKGIRYQGEVIRRKAGKKAVSTV